MDKLSNQYNEAGRIIPGVEIPVWLKEPILTKDFDGKLVEIHLGYDKAEGSWELAYKKYGEARRLCNASKVVQAQAIPFLERVKDIYLLIGGE